MTAGTVQTGSPVAGPTGGRRRPGAGWRGLHATRAHAGPWALVAPAVIIVTVLAILPLGYGVYLSLTNWSFLQGPAHLHGLSAYRELVHDHEFWSALVHTLEWTAGTVLIEIIVAVPLSVLLNTRTPITGMVTGLLLLPWVTPFVVLSYAWVYLYDGRFGPFHSLLADLHVVGAASPLSSAHQALWAVTIISGWKGIPFLTIALLAALKAIPDELREAAAVDGATWARGFWHVTLPLLRPTLGAMTVVLGVLAFYSFDLVWLTTIGGPGDSSTLIGVQLYKAFFISGRPGYAAAMATFTMLAFIVAAAGIFVVLRPLRRSR